MNKNYVVIILLGVFFGGMLGFALHIPVLDAIVFGIFFAILSIFNIRIKRIEENLENKGQITEQPPNKTAAEEDKLTILSEPKEVPVPKEVPKSLKETDKTSVTHKASDNFLTHFIKNSLGNLGIARIGVILLFIGVGFLVKYVSDKGILPIEYRLMGTSITSMVLVFLGWRLRKKSTTYGLLLQGAGIGILYITLFAAYRLYQLLPSSLTFLLLFLVALFSAMLAILQDSKGLAIFGVTGGFLAPILASTGEGSFVILFTYYSIINIGIFIISWYRKWNILNIIGFLFTFIIGSVWGYQYYKPENFWKVEPFLLINFLIYFILSMLFEQKNLQTPSTKNTKNVIDGGLLYALPIVTFALQSGLVKKDMQGLSLSAIGFAAFYILVAMILWKRDRKTLKNLVESYLSIGVCFLTLAVPFTFSGEWTAAVWAVEGVVLFFVGIRQNKPLSRWLGVALQFFGMITFNLYQIRMGSDLPYLNGYFSSVVLFGLSLWFISYLTDSYPNHTKPLEQSLSKVYYFIGLLWLLIGGYSEIFANVTYKNNELASHFDQHLSLSFNVFIIYLSILLGFSQLFGHGLEWIRLQRLRFSFIYIISILAIGLFLVEDYPFTLIGGIAWLIAMVSHYTILYFNEQKRNLDFSANQHTIAVWLITFLLTWQAYWLIEHYKVGADIWTLITGLVIPTLIIFLIMNTKNWLKWPIGSHYSTYLNYATVPILGWLAIDSLFLNLTQSGNPDPLPYLPILNPLDLTQIFALIIAPYWFLEVPKEKQLEINKVFFSIFGFILFLWLTGVLIRTVHHAAQIPWNFGSLWGSNIIQASLSIFWSIVSFGLMFFASRKTLKIVWMIGAILLAIVVIKLFFIDLSNIGTISRIISFIGTGILLLLIGYFAPFPVTKTTQG